jgi:hypothetical protein
VRSYADATRRWVPLVIVGGLLGVAAIAASIATPGVHSVPVPRVSDNGLAGDTSVAPADPFASASPGPLAVSPDFPEWILWAEAIVALGIALALVVIFTWHYISTHWLSVRQVARDPGGSPDALSDRREDVIAALDEGIARLSGDGDARSAVIACWVRLEEVAREAGTPRAVSDAPADLVSRLLGAHQVSSAALTSLAELYRTARYSANTIDFGMRERAVTALGQIRAELAASRSGPPLDDGQLYRTDGDRRRR